MKLPILSKRDSRFGIYLLKISLFEVFLGVFTLWFDLFGIYLSGISL
jgi:hypothetical protein